jgi:hypothetical protein
MKARGQAMGYEHRGKGVDIQLGPVAGKSSLPNPQIFSHTTSNKILNDTLQDHLDAFLKEDGKLCYS